MAFLDFLKNRQAAQQQPVANKPQAETAKQMYTREAARETTNPVDRLPAGEKVKVDRIKAVMEKATRHVDRNSLKPMPPDVAGTQEAMRHTMTDKAAPALSPTSMQAGQREQGTPEAPKTPAKTPEKPVRPQTVPRPRPSWER